MQLPQTPSATAGGLHWWLPWLAQCSAAAAACANARVAPQPLLIMLRSIHCSHGKFLLQPVQPVVAEAEAAMAQAVADAAAAEAATVQQACQAVAASRHQKKAGPGWGFVIENKYFNRVCAIGIIMLSRLRKAAYIAQQFLLPPAGQLRMAMLLFLGCNCPYAAPKR